MKKLIAIFTPALVLLSNIGTAFAQATCTVNGEEVPCEEVGEALGGVLGAGLGFIVVVLILSIVGFIIWLMMIIHAASKPIENKAMWIIIMILIGPIGAIIYYFVVKRNFKEGQPMQQQPPEQPQVPPEQPPVPPQQ
ncbi:PLDc N-terminal domain-containing protein [Pseudomonadota bacterium]